jgi:hypothetical protein
MEKRIDAAGRTIRLGLVAGTVAILSAAYMARHCCCCHAATARTSVTSVSERLARGNHWEAHADPGRPAEVVFLVDPARHHQSDALTFLRTSAPEWDGILRVETLVNRAGEVDPDGGLVWHGLWFFGDPNMLARVPAGLR